MDLHTCSYQIDNWQCLICNQAPTKEKQFYQFAPALAKLNDHFDSRFFPELSKLEAKNFWFVSRNHLITWMIKKYFANSHSLLEIGCGTGYVLDAISRSFPKIKLYGADIYLAALNFAAKRIPRQNLFQMDATAIPFQKQFDLVCAFDVLEHIDQDEMALANIFEAIRPGGGLLLTVPQHPSLWSEQDVHACHKRRYTLKDLEAKLNKAGFHILKTTSFVSLLLPLMLLSRKINKKSAKEFDPYRELRLNSGINFFLKTILSLERAFIKIGFSLPIGGSLLVAACRKQDLDSEVSDGG